MPQSTERWLPVVGYEDHYEVSDLGNVRRISPNRGTRSGRLLKPSVRSTGQPRAVVNLCVDGRAHTLSVHRLVAVAFLGNPGPEFEVCHNDGNPSNNRLDNLRWDTHYANYLDMVAHGRAYVMPKRDKCMAGHAFTPENSYIAPKTGKRSCRACRTINHRRRREERNSKWLSATD